MRRLPLIASVLVWVGVGMFWYSTTRTMQPTRQLAAIVTACLVAAYASAAYINHLALIPRFLRTGRPRAYAASIALTMIAPTALALAVIRGAFAKLHGPDADPNGAYKHFAIDLFGMAVHLAAASIVVWIFGRLTADGRGGTERSPNG